MTAFPISTRLRGALALALFSACTCSKTIEVPVVSPEGPQDEIPAFARFQLSQSLYDAAQPLPPMPDPKVVVAPAAPHRVKISSPYTVDVDFQGLAAATDYVVTLKSGLQSADHSATTKSDAVARFRTPLNRAVALLEKNPLVEAQARAAIPVLPGAKITTEAHGLPPLGPKSALGIEFRFPVTKAQARELVKVYAQDGKAIDVNYQEQDQELVDGIAVEPKDTWPRATPLVVTIAKGLKVAGPKAGPLATDAAQAVEVRTWGAQKLVAGPSSENGCVSAKTIHLEFANPVSCANALASLSFDQEATEVKCAGGDADKPARKLRVEAVPPLKGGISAKIAVAAGLVDAYGEKLVEAKSFEFVTCDPNESFAYQKPFVILDPGQAQEHVERVHGAAELKVEGKRVALPQLWKVVEEEEIGDQLAWTELPWWLSYGGEFWGDEGGGNSRKPGEIQHAAIAELEGAQSVKLPVPEAKAPWSDVTIGLEQFLGGKKGIVLMRVTPLGKDGKATGRSQLRVANVTDLGLSVRASRDALVVLAASYSTGKPVGGAKIVVLDTAGTKYVEGETGADGLLRLESPELARLGQLQSANLLVAATKGDDEAFVWSKFVVEWPYSSPGDRLVGLAYTDRGIYRPGEKVRYRALARFATPEGFGKVQGSVHVSIDEPEGSRVFDRDVEISQYGTLTGEWDVPATAKVGEYGLRVTVGNEQLYGSFRVGEFRRAEMKVAIQAPPHVQWGETLKAQVQADYLFGAPAGNLALHWYAARSSVPFRSERFPDAQFADPSLEQWGYGSESNFQSLSEGDAKLDANGAFPLALPMKLADPVSQRERIQLSATVDDVNGQSVSRQVNVDLFNAGVLVGVEARNYLVEAKKPYDVAVVAVTTDDQLAKDVEVSLRSRQTTWRSVRRAGPGGGYYWTSERIVENDVERCRGRTDERGRLKCTITPTYGGTLQLVAEAKDGKGRVARAGSWHWVYGDNDYWGGGSDTPQVSVMFEKSEIDAGDTIKVALASPFKEGVALVTIEREGILWQKSIEIGSSAQLEIPTVAAWAPNVHVVATVVRGRISAQAGQDADPEREKPSYAIGRREISIRPKGAALEVKVAVAKARLEPAQEQRASASVTGADGKPVEGAEVNLWAVDEGVLMLTNYATPNALAAMFQPRSYATLGLDTRAYILGKRIFVEPVIKGEEEGGGGGDENDANLRRNFDPVAVWVGSAITDASGRIDSTFKVPDNLTTYRVMAVAATQDDRFGHGDAEFKVNKILMLRQALPRFARPGDTLRAGVVVNTLQEGGGKATVSIEGLDEKLFKLSGERTREVEFKQNESMAVLFDLAVADAEGAAELRFSARLGDHKDRVELKIPVNRLTPRESVSAGGVVSSGTLQAQLALPPLARAVALNVNVSGLPIASLESKLRDMVSYPYGCLEQKTSKVLPLMAIRRLADELKLASIPSDQIRVWVEEYLGVVPRFRCNDGGFDYWEGCAWGSSTYLTSFALDGLLTAKRLGYPVKQDEIDKTVTYLKRMVQAGDKGKDQYGGHGHEDESFAGALRVLAEAGSAEPAIEKAVFDKRSSLPLFSKTELTRAMAARLGPGAKGDENVKTLLSEIAKVGKEVNGALTFDAEAPDRYWWAWESKKRNTALVLRTLARVDSADGRIPLVVKGLIDLDGSDRHYVTADTTQVLLGLTEVVEALKPTSKGPVATVKVGGETLLGGEKVGGPVKSLALAAEKVLADNAIEVGNTGDSPLYFGAFLTYAFPAGARLPAADHGFTVKREYLGKDGKPLPLARDGDVGSLKLKAGDFVKVRLTVDVRDEGRLVVIEDPLPAGLEVVDTSLATADLGAARAMGEGGERHWWDNFHRSIRDDRVEWHFESVWKHRLELSYVARATTAGTFHAPGSRAERMYQPEINGRAESLNVSVSPKP